MAILDGESLHLSDMLCNETSEPYTPQHNGVAERAFGIIIGDVRKMLYFSRVSNRWWIYAAKAAVLSRNLLRHPDRPDEPCPHEKFYGKPPDNLYPKLRVWGSRCMVLRQPLEPGSKLAPRADVGVFLGYGFDCVFLRGTLRRPMGYVTAVNNKVVVTHHVLFDESGVIERARNRALPSTSNMPADEPDDGAVDEGGMVDIARTDADTDNYTLEIPDDGDATEEENAPRDAAESCSSSDDEDDNADYIPTPEPSPPRERPPLGSDRARRSSTAKQTEESLQRERTSSSPQAAFVELDPDYISGQLASMQDELTTEAEALARANLAVMAADIPVPQTYKEALESKHSTEWLAAIVEELNSHRLLRTYTHVQVPKGTKVLPTRFVFTVKSREDGTVDKFKARLVTQGFRQVKGINYNEIFSPTIRYEQVRIMLAIATYYRTAECRCRAIHADVKTAHINAPVPEPNYVALAPGEFPTITAKPGFIVAGRVNKGINGLKQSPRAWFLHYDGILRDKCGFNRLRSAWCVYTRKEADGSVTIIGVYVDDLIIITGSSDPTIADNLIKQLNAHFEVKDLGELSYFLGMQVQQDDNRTTVSCPKYIRGILESYGMEDAATVDTPCRLPGEISEQDKQPLDAADTTTFRSITGSLMWVMNACRPDISFATNKLARAMSAPSRADLVAAKRVLRYLSGTIDFGICYFSREYLSKHDPTRAKLHYILMSDSSYADDEKTRKSTGAWFSAIAGGAGAYCTQLQSITATSSTHAEYNALAECAREALFERDFLSELQFKPGEEKPQRRMIYVDNQAAIQLSKNPVFHKQSKHIDVRMHMIRDCIELDAIMVEKVHTDDNIADGLTKALPRDKFMHFVSQIMVRVTHDD